MIYISISYYLFLLPLLLFYYLLPKKIRWTVLLVGSVFFYVLFYRLGWWIVLLTILLSFFFGLLINKTNGTIKKISFVLSIVIVVIPWFVTKRLGAISSSLIVPLGISFYTMQLIAYLSDVYQGKIQPDKNLAKYALFVSFFPQILQGPIPRYKQLQKQLIEGHEFDEKGVTKGFYYIIWGFFLKIVIADKISVFVNNVFDNCPLYTGVYIWVAAILYSIQIYADFLACTTLAQGVSKLFGIELVNNFERPYLSTSVKDFWKRWHISLSSWLKDYIYIPLGGNRKGEVRKEINLFLTFVVSGFWHGAGANYIVWGLIHAFYQMSSKYLSPVIEKMLTILGVGEKSASKLRLERLGTFFLVTMAWIIFRAENFRMALRLIKHMFFDVNPWVLFNDGLFSLGLIWKDWVVLILSIIVLFRVDIFHESGGSVSEKVMSYKLPIRWGITMGMIVVIVIFGTYGMGFNAQDFIYGGF